MFPGAETRGIKHDGKHVVVKARYAQPVWQRRHAAKQRTAQQVTHHRQRVTLVPRRGEQCAERRIVHHRRVGGGLALVIDQRAGRRRPLAVVGDTHLAHRDGAGGEIKEYRWPVAARQADRERVGAEAALAAAVRRDDGAADHIGEMNRREICRNRLLGPVADAPNVVRVLEAHDHYAVLACALDGELHGLKRH